MVDSTNNSLPAVLGGDPVIAEKFTQYATIGDEEITAVNEVLKGGNLSGFIGAWCPQFNGGEKVQELEKNWAKYFNVKHAISVNSATSGLYASIGALGIEPGDEVIVTPTTMTATVTGIVLYQAIPVFADICPHTFCIDPKDIERKISDKTRAIIGVDIYGETAEWDEINKIAKKYKLKVIEDSAQSFGGTYNGKKSGTLADIGVYSLNRHKHVHCGEGGICVTNDDELAERIKLIRNHGEAVVEDKGTENIVNILGFNFRMTEVEAAIAIEQLKKLDYYVEQRRDICNKIIDAFSNIKGITPPLESPMIYPYKYEECCRPKSTTTKHVYYYLCFTIDKDRLGMSRKVFVESMIKEGVPLGEGGYMPVYLQPMYQKKIAFGTKGFPFTADYYGKEISYAKGICPIAEKMWFEDLFYVQVQNYVPSDEQIKKFKLAAEKVINSKDEINKHFLEN